MELNVSASLQDCLSLIRAQLIAQRVPDIMSILPYPSQTSEPFMLAMLLRSLRAKCLVGLEMHFLCLE